MRAAVGLMGLMGCTRACAVGTEVPGHQITVGTLPSSGARPELAGLDPNDGVRETLAEDLLDEVAPDVLEALGHRAEDAELSQHPSGDGLSAAPALQIRLSCTDDEAMRVAAAFAWVLRQDEVYALNWTSSTGAVAWGGVRFLEGAPEIRQVEALQSWLYASEPALQGWYTAWGDTVFVMNRAGDDGQPVSGLTDEQFMEALVSNTAEYTDDAVVFDSRGAVELWRGEVPWVEDPDGAGWLDLVDADAPLIAALEAENEEAMGWVDSELGIEDP